MTDDKPMHLTRRGWLALLGAAALTPPFAVAHAEGKRVLVLLSSADDRTIAITQAFKAGLKGGLVMTYDLGQQTDAGAFIADNIRGMEVSLVFAVGDLAARAASREFSTVPIIHAEVQDTTSLVERPGLEAVSSWPDPAQSIERLAKVIRPLNSVGLVRTARTSPQVDAVVEAGKAQGVQINTRGASGASDLENAVAGLLAESDVVWLLPDAAVLTSSLLAKLLHKAHVEQKLIATWSTDHFKGSQPAALAISTGPDGVGSAAAERVSELLAGTTDMKPVYAPPELYGHFATLRRARVTVNKSVAAEFDGLER